MSLKEEDLLADKKKPKEPYGESLRENIEGVLSSTVLEDVRADIVTGPSLIDDPDKVGSSDLKYSIIEAEEREAKEEIDKAAKGKDSIFDMVVEVESLFDSIREDLDEIRAQEERREKKKP